MVKGNITEVELNYNIGVKSYNKSQTARMWLDKEK